MTDSRPKSFIQLLDDYRDKSEYLYSDYATVMQLVNYHYITNKLGSVSNVGYRPSNKNTTPSKYYSLFGESMWNSSSPDAINKSEPVDETFNFLQYHVPPILRNQYDFYSQPLIGQGKTILYENPPPPPIEEVIIDAKIETFADLITLIQTTEYRHYVKYNIDLKALMQVKDELLQLNNMIGMTHFKDAVLNQLLYFIQGLHKGKDPDFMHTVLSGPPGTGKTEVATLLGKIYSKLGILKNRVFKKATRSDLVAGYLGQTAIKTAKLIQDCLGGCLFIDEAYSLGYTSNGNSGDADSYSKECLDTLCEALSAHKEDLMVIIAGYEDELKKTFFSANQGLDSRFIWRFTIDSYSYKELMQIFKKKVQENGWSFSVDVDDTTLAKWFDKYSTTFTYYGRDMELLFSYTKVSHGRRIYGKPEDQRKMLTIVDLDAGYASFLSNKNTKLKGPPIPYGMYV